MAVYRVQRTRDYTVMSNYHLKDKGLTLKSKGLLSMILSLPEEWNYTTRGLASICKEGVDAIGSALKELETAGYIVRRQLRGTNGRITDTEYIIYSGFVRQSYIIDRQIDRKLSLAVICKLTVRLHLGKAVFLVVLILFAGV